LKKSKYKIKMENKLIPLIFFILALVILARKLYLFEVGKSKETKKNNKKSEQKKEGNWFSRQFSKVSKDGEATKIIVASLLLVMLVSFFIFYLPHFSNTFYDSGSAKFWVSAIVLLGCFALIQIGFPEAWLILILYGLGIFFSVIFTENKNKKPSIPEGVIVTIYQINPKTGFKTIYYNYQNYLLTPKDT